MTPVEIAIAQVRQRHPGVQWKPPEPSTHGDVVLRSGDNLIQARIGSDGWRWEIGPDCVIRRFDGLGTERAM